MCADESAKNQLPEDSVEELNNLPSSCADPSREIISELTLKESQVPAAQDSIKGAYANDVEASAETPKDKLSDDFYIVNSELKAAKGKKKKRQKDKTTDSSSKAQIDDDAEGDTEQQQQQQPGVF